MTIWSFRSGHRAGFSLLEVLVTVVVIGILAAVAVGTSHHLRQGTSRTKLISDVATVNQSIQVYLANGGNLDGIANAQAVLEKMKTHRDAQDAAAYAGLRAEMIDPRLVAILQTEAESAGDAERAMWNPAKKRFEVVRSGGIGVAHFALDEATGAVERGTEVRKAGPIALNRGNGWIWAYEDALPQAPATPTPVPLTAAAPSPAPVPQTPGRMAPPVFNPSGGTFQWDTFPSQILVTNPNPDGGQILIARQWSEGGVEWQVHDGLPVSVQPGQRLLAYVRGVGGGREDSFTVSGEYGMNNLDLQGVTIRTSEEWLDLGSNGTVTVELENPNDPAFRSGMEYSISGGEYVAYGGPIHVTPSAHVAGFEIVARAVPTIPGFNPSPDTNRMLPLKLAPPIIGKAQEDSRFRVTLLDTNQEGLGQLRYAIRDLATDALGAWQEYGDVFEIEGRDYGKGFEVVAFTAAVRSGYLDSDQASSKGRSFFGVNVAKRAILVLDVSGSMAWNGRLAAMQAEAKQLLASMPEDGKMALVTFNGRAREVFSYQTMTSGKITEAQLLVDGLRASGWTNYSDALGRALSIVEAFPDVEQVVFLSDGAPTAGDTSESGILGLVDQIASRNVLVSPIGYEMTTVEERELIRKMKERGQPRLP